MFSYSARKYNDERTLSVASVAGKARGSDHGLYLADNRPRSVLQKKQVDGLSNRQSFLSVAGKQNKTGNNSRLQLEDNRPRSVWLKKQAGISSGKQASVIPLRKENKTGLPDQLKYGIENLSGLSMDDVKVHYNSSKPVQLNALAFAQGTEIHLAPGEEKHLAHEAWHVVQQKQGRVKPTIQMKGEYINDSRALEIEADEMGARAQLGVTPVRTILKSNIKASTSGTGVIQGQFIRVQVRNRTGIFWLDENAKKVYKQIEVQVDNRLRVAGHGEDFYIDYINGQWDRISLNPLTERQTAAAREILLGPAAALEGDAPIAEQDLDQRILTAMVEQLRIYVHDTLAQVRASDNPGVDLGPDSSRGRILRRAVRDIMALYGVAIDTAAAEQHDTTARGNLLNAALRHSTERWQHAGPAEKLTAARLAIVWAMSNVNGLSALVTQVRVAHRGSSTATIIDAYSTALCSNAANNVLLSGMAEIRLRWGPITYGRAIFLEVGRAGMDESEQWWLYRTLIHEALHSAEHPSFALFLQNNIPEGLQSDIREGIVEYLTQRIWARVLRQAIREGDRFHANIAGEDPAVPLRAARRQINVQVRALRHNDAYPVQLQTITALVNILHNGDARLEAAYFFGNVAALLPRLTDDEEDDDE